MEKTLRIPRPQSTTLLSIKHQKTKSNKDLYNLISSITHHYTSNGFHYLTKSLTLPELSYYTNLSIDQLSTGIIEQQSTFTKLLSPTNQEDLAKVLRIIFAEVLGASFSDRNRYEKLVGMMEGHLAYERSGKPNVAVIHPYIKALELGVKQQTSLQGLIGLLKPSGPQSQINFLTNITQADPKALPDEQRPLTREEAMQLIEGKANQLMGDEAHEAQIHTSHQLSEAPDVRANKGDEKGPIMKQGMVAEALNQGLILDVEAEEVQ